MPTNWNETLQHLWPERTLRPAQENILQHLDTGASLLAILPTNAGKSLLYQLSAIAWDAPVVVISPLVALMEDQMRSFQETLQTHGYTEDLVFAWTGTPTNPEALHSLNTARLILLAPERLSHSVWQQWAQSHYIRLLVIDEAHCLSEWGWDFRPDYRQIPQHWEQWGAPQILALTATAPANVREDLQALFPHLEVIRESVDRPNIRYAVWPVHNGTDQEQAVIKALQTIDGQALIYAGTRKDTERWAQKLQEWVGKPVGFYHAGLDNSTRARMQEAFLTGQISIMVATIAFGMGINLPHIRGVIHLSTPKSLAAYAQETGRAGRDGQPAYAIAVPLLTREKSIHRGRQNHRQKLWQAITTIGNQWSLTLPDRLPEGSDITQQAMKILAQNAQEQGIANTLHAEWQWYQPWTTALTQKILAQLAKQANIQDQNWNEVMAYWESPHCRRREMLRALDEPHLDSLPTPAVCCDHCHPTNEALRQPMLAVTTSITRLNIIATTPWQAIVRWRETWAALLSRAPYQLLSDEDVAALAASTPTDWAQWFRQHPAIPSMAQDALRQLWPAPITRPPQENSWEGVCEGLWFKPQPTRIPQQQRLIRWTDSTCTCDALDIRWDHARIIHKGTQWTATTASQRLQLTLHAES